MSLDDDAGTEAWTEPFEKLFHGARILVTGASGLLGRALVRHLPSAKYRVGALCRRPPGAEVHEWLRIDLAGAETLAKTVDTFKPDLIFHLGAAVGDQLEEESTHRINVEASRVLKNHVAAHPGSRMIAASSVLVMGLQDLIDADESLPYTDRPFISYVRSKIAMERVLLADGGGCSTTVLRFPRIYGPGEERILPGLLRVLRERRLVLIDGGRKLQSFLHVDDAVQALLRAAMSPGRISRVHHICDGMRVENRHLFEIIARAAGLEPPSRSIPFWLALALSHVATLRATLHPGSHKPEISPFRVRLFGRHHHYSIERARRELGYTPSVTVEHGLRKVVASVAAARTMDGGS